MVGPLSSEEIEDVVSSVRRLVSNEQSSRRATRDLGADRLLLTPALRVVTEASPLAPLVLDAPASERTDPDRADPVADAAVTLEDMTDAAESDFIEAEWEDEIWVAPEPASLGEVALGAEEAEVLVPAADKLAADAVAEFLAATDESADAWAPSDWTEDEPVPFIPLRRRAEHLAARLAAGEVLDVDDPEDALPDEVESEAPQIVAPDVAPELLEDDPLAVDLDGDAAVTGSLSEEGADPGNLHRMPTEILDADGTPLAVLDEAALQEIVRQMIREELQGSLGERITRNVRKLVRAEINRALIARDLD